MAATAIRRAVQAPSRVESQASNRLRPVDALSEGTEAVQHLFRPASIRIWRQSETVPAPKSPAPCVVP